MNEETMESITVTPRTVRHELRAIRSSLSTTYRYSHSEPETKEICDQNMEKIDQKLDRLIKLLEKADTFSEENK